MALRPIGTIIEQVGLSLGETVSGRMLYRWCVVAHVRVGDAAGRERLAEEIRLVEVRETALSPNPWIGQRPR